jgi:hypothetical protein
VFPLETTVSRIFFSELQFCTTSSSVYHFLAKLVVRLHHEINLNKKLFKLQLKRIRIGSSFKKDKYNEWFMLQRDRLHLSPKKINY